MDNQDVTNWMKLDFLLDYACTTLRKLFYTSWRTKFDKEWEASSSSIILEHELLQNIDQFQREIIAKEDVNSWDTTTLLIVLTAKDLLNLPRKQAVRIQKLAAKRNYLADHPTKIITTQEFSNLWDEITSTLVFFGESKDKLKQLKMKSLVGDSGFGSKTNCIGKNGLAEATRLKNEGNAKINAGEYAEAIKIFSKSVALPGVPAAELAVLHANLCVSYLKQCEEKEYDKDLLLKAHEVAKKTIALQPEWWRGHFRLGQVYSALEEYEKAVPCLNDALERNPRNPEITLALSHLFKKVHDSCMKQIHAKNKDLDDVNQKRTPTEEDLKLLKEHAHDPRKEKCNHSPAVPETEFTIGMCYAEGVGVTKDIHEAVNWLERASEHDCSCAANSLGLLYEHGEVDGKKDIEKAEYFYKLAASHWMNPDTNAMVNLALLYAEKCDYESAVEWCQQAKRSGSSHPLLHELSTWLTNMMDEFRNSGVVDWEIRSQKSTTGLTMEQRKERYCTEVGPILTSLFRKISGNRLELNTVDDVANNRIKTTCFRKDGHASERKHLYQSLPAMYQMLHIMEVLNISCLTIAKRIVEQFVMLAQEEFNSHSSSELQFYDLPVLHQLMKLRTPATENLHETMCSLLVKLSPELARQFTDDCVQKYPKNGCFYAARARIKFGKADYLGAILDLNFAVMMNPSNTDLVYERAYFMQVANKSSATFTPPQVLDAYELLVAISGKEHGKLADAYHGISRMKFEMLCYHMGRDLKTLNKDEWEKRIDEVRKFHDLSVASFSKESVHPLPLNVTTKEAFERIMLKAQKDYEYYCHQQELNHANRISLILQHREFEKTQHEFLSKIPKEVLKIRNTVRSSVTQVRQPPPFLDNYRPITFHEMTPNDGEIVLYDRRFIEATVVDVVAYVSGIPQGIVLVIEDTNGYVESCVVDDMRLFAVLGGNLSFGIDLPDYPTGFSPGQKLLIINPHARKSSINKKAGIEVVATIPKGIIPVGVIENMCRFCYKANATFTCAKCKKAKYCDRRCQKMDWNKLKHSLVCRVDV